jgi:hypothetical protein
MIDVRVEIPVDEGVFVTGPIHNPQALDALLGCVKDGQPVLVHADHDNALIADQALAIARQEGTLSQLRWGPTVRGEPRYRVEIAPLPKAAGKLPVVGGFPLLDGRPSPVAPFDHGGGHRKPRATPPAESIDQLADEYDLPRWLVWITDRVCYVAAWIVGHLYCLIMAQPKLRVVRED